MSVNPVQPSSTDPAYLSQAYPSQFPPPVAQPQHPGLEPPPPGYHPATREVRRQRLGAICKACGGKLVSSPSKLGIILCLVVPIFGLLCCLLTYEFKCSSCGRVFNDKGQEIIKS